MIASNELRLGNLVLAPQLWADQYFNVFELYAEECSVSPDVKSHARIISYQALEPIGLTSALLQSFGFEPEEYGLHQLAQYMVLKQGPDDLYLNRDLQPVVSPTQPILLTRYRIQYFHQLQNLFYSITGSDFSIFASRR